MCYRVHASFASLFKRQWDFCLGYGNMSFQKSSNMTLNSLLKVCKAKILLVK